MTEFQENRKTLYDNLLNDGYFRDEDGNINYPYEDFDESLNENENIITLYRNLLDDGYFRDENGEINFSETDFVAMLGKRFELRTYYPLTGNQLGIYADWEMNRNTTQYNIPTLLRYTGVDVERLVEALRQVVDAHPYLKMRLAETPEGVMQQRRDDAETKIEVRKLQVEPEKEYFQALVQPFDLFNDDLYRIVVVETPSAVYFWKDMHHIIFDGGSMGIFNAQLRDAYAGKELQTENYTAYDFALEEEARQQGEKYTEAEAFFDKMLEGQTATAYPSSFEVEVSATQSRTLHKNLNVSVSEYCRQHAITPNSFFMAALSLLMHKVTREDDIMYITVSHGRNTMEMMDIMGMFVKTLPVTSSMEGKQVQEECFSKFARKVHRQYVDVVERDFYPFTTMVERHGVRPEILFAYQDGSYSSDEEATDNGLKAERIPLTLDTTKTNITIEIQALGNDSYILDIEYNTNKYGATDMQRLLNAYATIVKQVCKEDMAVGDIELVGMHEKEMLKALGCGDSLDYNFSDTMVDILQQQTALTPDATAIVYKDHQLTYAEVDSLTDRLAYHIKKLGVGRGQAVGVMIERSELMLIYPMAIMKAGGAYMPLDPHFPEERLVFMCEDAGVKLILSEGNLVKNVMPSFTGDVVVSSELQQLPELPKPFVVETKTDDAAVILFTSGSTGKPKGVVLEHHGVVNFAHWYAKEMKMDQTSKSVGYANFGFDAHMIDIYPTLLVGGTVHILPEELRMDLVAMNDYIETNGLTTAFFTTQIGCQMVSLFDNPCLKCVSTGGEKMPPVKKPAYDFYNVYGPTECSLFSTYYKIEEDYFNADKSVIGKPLDNYKLYVVDKNLHLVPRGVPGELVIAGIGVGREYLNRPEITAEKFIEIDGQKAYRSGDLVRWTEDGNIQFLGRIDNQVKLRGLRIELGEIEAVVAKYDSIRQVVVDVKEVNGVQHLCCYYVSDKTIDENALKAYLGENLTEFMIPTQYMQLEALPLTPNGKVNRKALPIPVIENDVEYIEPSTEAEKVVAQYFANVLNLSTPVSALDNFFSLGGDSIKAIRLVSMLRQEGMVLTVAQIMKLKTVDAIAAAASESDQNCKIDQENWSGKMPNSAIVQYFFDLNLPVPQHFNQSSMLRCAGRVDMEALKRSLNAIAKHHDVLRAQVKEGMLDVRAYDSDACYYDFYEYQIDDNSEVAGISSMLQGTLDIERGNMMRVTVFHGKECDYVFIIIHHLLVDGISWRIIIEDLNIAYSSAKEGKEPKLPAKTHSYKYYAEAMERYKQSYALAQEKGYWEKVRSLVTNMEGSQVDDYSRQFGYMSAQLDKNTTYELLHNSNKAFNTEINDLLLTALGRAYCRLSKKQDVSIQLEGHGREPIDEPLEIDRTVGWFTSIFPVVLTKLGKDIRKDIRHTKETLHAIPNKGLGYGQLFGMDCHKAPMIGFNYHGVFNEGGGSSTQFFTIEENIEHKSGYSEKNTFITNISINSAVNGGGQLQYNAVYNKNLFSANDMELFNEYFLDELRNIVEFTAKVEKPELTAADLGETEWTDEEFLQVYNQFLERGINIRRIYPLTPMQESMLLKVMAEPDTTAYRIFYQLNVNALLSEQQISHAMQILMAKHEVLSTAFVYKNVSLYRQVLTDRRIPVIMEDATGVGDIETFLREIRSRETDRGFDLQDDALMRVVCVKTSNNSCKLMLFFHHIIIDGWCLHLVFSDLRDALANGAHVNIEDVKDKNAGVYEAHVHELAKRNRTESLEYWRKLLAGYEQKAVIPSHGRLSEEQRNNSSHAFLDIEPEIISKLADICDKAGVTINSLVELVWGITLGVYNNTQDTVFVKVVSGRNSSSLNLGSVVGLCINSVPVRIKFDYNDTVVNALRKVQSQAAETNEHDYCPLSEIIAQTELQSELFQSVMAFENYPSEEKADEPAALSITGDDHDEEVFSDISFSVSTNDEKTKMLFNMSYDTALYREQDIRQVLDTIHELLKNIAEQGDVKLSSLKLVPDAAIEKLKVLGKGEELVYDYNDTMVDILRKQANLTPDAACTVCNGRKYTYRQIDELSDRLAVHLQSLGIGRGSAVGLMINRSELILIYSMAVMKAGGAYMPLDSKFPEDRLMFMCEDAGVKVILTYKNLATTVLPHFGGIILSDSELQNLPAVKDQIRVTAKANDAAVILYTSGSTGMPKGCVLEHHGIVNYAHWYKKELQMTQEDVVAAYANFGFDAHMIDIYPTLLSGATLHILTEEVRMDLLALNNYINDNDITVAFFTTQIGCQIASLFPENHLRAMTIGGEKMPPTKRTSYPIYNGYGPTECSLYSTCYKVEGDYDGVKSIIGRPLANYQLYVVDRNLHLVPCGVPGELVIAGIGVGREYLNQPELTAQKFITFEGQKAYRSGDLVRWCDDGNIEFLGRIDNQVKLRGLRIELGEIENQALSIEGVNQVAAIVKNMAGLDHLVLYYTVNEGMDVPEFTIQNCLEASTLPHFMIPEAFVKLDAMPYNANGKIDRKSLPDPVIKLTEYEAPRSDTEQAICDGMATVLHLEKVGIDDDFFKLGGTSLTALKLQYQLGLKWLTVRTIIEEKTARRMVQKLIENEQNKLASAPSSESEMKLLEIAQRMLGNENISVVHDLVTIANNFTFVSDFVKACQSIDINVTEEDVKAKRSIRELVTGEQSLAYWHQPYDASKPVLISVCGMVPQEFLKYRMDELSKTFNVLVFWPTFDFADYGFSEDSLSEIIKLYHELVYIYLPDGVRPFGYIGYCLGGVISLMMAKLMQEAEGYYPVVYMLDSWPEVTFKESFEYEEVDEHGLNYDDLPEFLKNRLRFVRAISKDTVLPKYDGYTVLFAATICEGHDIPQNKAYWQSLCPKIKIYDLPGTHDDIVCGDIHTDFVVRKVNKDYNKKNK
jgi:amino acid adenylation domain-containing protein/non-ribosomal peptide synthase protein (TIGR01720 family)